MNRIPAIYKKLVLLIIIFAHIFVSYNIWKIEQDSLKDKSYNLFLSKVNDESKSIEGRLEVYADTLYSVRGLFAQTTSKDIQKEDWDLYIESLKTFDRYPGITNIYFIKYVKQSELQSYVQAKKVEYAKVDTNFSTNNFSEKSSYYIIDLVYPFANNSSKIGTDIITASTFSNELDSARDRGVPTSTAINYFTKDILDKPQVNILLPIYKNFADIDTVQARRDSLIGFVTMSFKIDQLIETIFDNAVIKEDKIDLEIYDTSTSDQIIPENLVYQSNKLSISTDNFFEKDLVMTFGGRTWNVVFKTPDTYQRNTSAIDYNNITFFLMLLSGMLLIYIAYQFTQRN